jgi:hypothetical protein
MDPPCSAPASCFRWGAPDSSACLAQRNMLGSPRLIIQRAVTRLTRSGGSRPELRLLRCRSSSGNSLCGQNSAGFRESARPFKGIICDDISEFESSPSLTHTESGRAQMPRNGGVFGLAHESGGVSAPFPVHHLRRTMEASHGNASTICRASHSAVGCRVTANQSSCRRP